MALLSPALGLEGSRLSLPMGQLRKSLQPALGCPLQQTQRMPLTVRAAQIKRRKEPSLDRVIDQNKKLKIARKIAEVLSQQDGLCMTLRELGKYRQRIGLTGGRRCVVLLRRFPGLFRVYDEGAGNIWFTFTREAAEQYSQERALKQTLEDLAVTKVQKLLMMAPSRRVRLENLTHVRRELGLPDDFKTGMIHNNPDLFRVVAEEGDVFVELTSWDPALAVSALEAKERVRQERLRDEGAATGATPAEGQPRQEGHLSAGSVREHGSGTHGAHVPGTPLLSPWEGTETEVRSSTRSGGARGEARPRAWEAEQGHEDGEEGDWEWEGEDAEEDSETESASAFLGREDLDSATEQETGRVRGWEQEGSYSEDGGPYSDRNWLEEEPNSVETVWESDSDVEEPYERQVVGAWDRTAPDGSYLVGEGAAKLMGSSVDAGEPASGDELAARAIALGRRVVTSAIASASGTDSSTGSPSARSASTGESSGWTTDTVTGTGTGSALITGHDVQDPVQLQTSTDSPTSVQKRPPMRLPPGLKLPKKDMFRLRQFHSAPLGSPYLPPDGAEGAEGAAGGKGGGGGGGGGEPEPGSLEAERRWVAVVHELLSLTVEKRLLVDQLTHFRRDLKLTQRIHSLLVRHPEYFYVSLKGLRHSVFLREAYSGGLLIDKDALGEALEELRRLSHLRGRRQEREEGGGGGEGEGGWGDGEGEGQGEGWGEDSGGEGEGEGTWEDWHHSPSETPSLVARRRAGEEKSRSGKEGSRNVPEGVLLTRQARQARAAAETEKW